MGIPFMKFYPLDFISDPLVEMLSMSARGCYITLLCKLWMANEPYLPNDPVKLARLAGLSPKEFLPLWEEIQQPGSEIFTIAEQGGAEVITQKRLLKEWNAVDEIGETRRQAVNKRYTSKGTKQLQNSYKTDTNDLQTELQNSYKTPTNELQSTLQNDNKTGYKTGYKTTTNDDRYSDTQIFRSSDTQILDLEIPDSRETSFAPGGAESASGISKPDLCPHKAIIDLYHRVLPELPRVREWEAPRQTLLRSQWKKPGRGNLGFWQGYFELVRQSSFLLGGSDSQNGKAPFIASMEWLIRPKNMPKVLEGNYTDREPRKGTAGGRNSPRTPSIGDHFRAMAEEILAEAEKGQVIDITDSSAAGTVHE